MRMPAILASALLWFCITSAAAAAAPNIIFIMADDHPWPVYGFMKTIEDTGAIAVPTQHPELPPIETPNLDRLADRGVVFPVAASASTRCEPSYTAALTGLYSKSVNETPISDDKVRIPGYLADGGYLSYAFGKYWGTYEQAGFTHGVDREWDLPRVTLDPLWEFVDARDPNGPPWFIWYAPRLPHAGYRFSRQYYDLFPRSMFQRRRSRARKVYANVRLLDFWIGELLDGLSARGLDSSTLLVFMSDNGYLLRDSKNKYGENGFRTPILISWPDGIPAAQVRPQMVHAVDILPTLLDYADIPIPPGLDGESMRPYCDDPDLPGREYLLNVRHGRRFLRTRDGLRLVSRDLRGRHLRLYDLTVDPDERDEVSTEPEYEELIPVLKQALDDFWDPLEDS